MASYILKNPCISQHGKPLNQRFQNGARHIKCPDGFWRLVGVPYRRDATGCPIIGGSYAPGFEPQMGQETGMVINGKLVPDDEIFFSQTNGAATSTSTSTSAPMAAASAPIATSAPTATSAPIMAAPTASSAPMATPTATSAVTATSAPIMAPPTATSAPIMAPPTATSAPMLPMAPSTASTAAAAAAAAAAANRRRIRAEISTTMEPPSKRQTGVPKYPTNAAEMGFAIPIRPTAAAGRIPHLEKKNVDTSSSKRPMWQFSCKQLQRCCPLCLFVCNPSNSLTVTSHIQTSQCGFILLNFPPRGEDLNCNQCSKEFHFNKLLNVERIQHMLENNHSVTCAICEKNVLMSELKNHLISESYLFFSESNVYCKCKHGHSDTPTDFFVHLQRDHQISNPNLAYFNKFLPDSFRIKRNLLLFSLLHTKYTQFS